MRWQLGLAPFDAIVHEQVILACPRHCILTCPSDFAYAWTGDFGLPTALPPQPSAAESVAADASSQLGNAADQTAALAATLAVAAAARAPASAPVSFIVPSQLLTRESIVAVKACAQPLK